MSSHTGIAPLFLSGVVSLTLAGCGVSSILDEPSPQQERTFTGTLTEEQKAIAADKPWWSLRTNSLEEKLAAEERAALSLELDVKVADLGAPAPFADIGFLPQSGTAYAVYRSGVAGVFSETGDVSVYDQLVKQVDRVLTAREGEGRIVGLAAHGTQASWNASDPTQQVYLRPQTTTFGQVKLYDAQLTGNGKLLATASEGGLIEFWDLQSGDIKKSTRLTELQPRTIAENSDPDQIIFGANNGEVHVLPNGPVGTALYAHAGPLLRIIEIPSRNLVVSAAKDGVVKIYDKEAKEVVFSEQFEKAVYQIEVAHDASGLVIIPAVGDPLYVELEEYTSKPLYRWRAALVSRVAFGASSNALVAQYADDEISFWNLDKEEPESVEIDSPFWDRAISFALAGNTNVIAVLIEDNSVEYWDIATQSRLGAALSSAVDIERIALSDNAQWLLVGLADGRLLRQRVEFGRDEPYEFE